MATVITNLLSAIPVFGQDLVESNYATELSSCLGILPSPASCARRAKPNLPSPALEAATLPLPAKQAEGKQHPSQPSASEASKGWAASLGRVG